MANFKDKQLPSNKSNVIYQINCKNCDKKYIGETKKMLKDRVKEHKSYVNNKNKLSLIYKHANETTHNFDFDSAKVLAQNNHRNSRRLLESFYTATTSNAINRSMGFSEIYKPTINEVLK